LWSWKKNLPPELFNYPRSYLKRQLAGLLGTIPETLSRIFSKMNDRGLIEVEGKSIQILCADGLEDLAVNGKI